MINTIYYREVDRERDRDRQRERQREIERQRQRERERERDRENQQSNCRNPLDYVPRLIIIYPVTSPVEPEVIYIKFNFIYRPNGGRRVALLIIYEFYSLL